MSNSAVAVPPLPATPELSRLEPLRPMPLHDVQRAMGEYQAGLAALLNDNDWQTFSDRGGQPRRFVKRTGWRKIATWFGLDLYVGRITVERYEDGRIRLAEVVGRVVAPNGRVGEDIGACSADERGFSKPEHDIRATATTRALNRAISNLVGMGDLTAEEVLDEVEPMLPEWAQPCSDELGHEMMAKLAELLGAERAEVLTRAIANRYDGVPNVVTGVVTALHKMLTAAPAEGAAPTQE
jgi:hypothetical protein